MMMCGARCVCNASQCCGVPCCKAVEADNGSLLSKTFGSVKASGPT